MKKFNNRSNAFTLVEMLVVLGMLSILMGVTFTGLGKARTQARIVKANAEIRELMNAWLAYEAAYDDWPMKFENAARLDADKTSLAELLGENNTDTVFLNAQLVDDFFVDPWGTPYKFSIVKETGDNKATDEFGAAITFPNRHRPFQ